MYHPRHLVVKVRLHAHLRVRENVAIRVTKSSLISVHAERI